METQSKINEEHSNAMATSFKESLDINKRKTLSSQILATHAGRVPVIVERSTDSKNLPIIERKKFLTPAEYTVAKFQQEILNHLPIDEFTSINLYVGKGVMAMPALLMRQLYDIHKDEDGFLYVTYGEHKAMGL